MYTSMASMEENHWWYVGRRRIISSFLNKIAEKKKLKIIELGSGTGGNLMMLSAYGDVVGMEPNGFGRQLAISRGFDVCDGMLPDLPFRSGEADLVVMFDVLEHLDDDAGCLRAAANLLKPDGHLFLTVPAYSWMWSNHDVKNHHKRRYNKEQLLDLARRIGFRVERCSYFNTLLFPMAAAVRIIKNMTGATSDDGTMPAPATNKILLKIFSFEKKILSHGNLPFGLSIAMILHK
ncbi:class I SAM-dependent methyltransferase [Gluconacetobacter azotocaptans]|uniref:Class I SAM-dependent methyltransferase n=2 Tax=Gluconacetobacter azotocaptans TaxID=142834 RepID=A0A7W4PHY9_9PROT|nr:class I SAM-dependent methyltransferase [Gluconacetobacter azotocaptans]MBB2191596.1 class I SAM-dependent methyltransferase [Gluconacetobacter azotocaptans]MBM9403491.1 class I SAM-dependent methyltransferase [Gluconacetobacter azotocaptans]